ncbi:MAG: hypothetical protein M5R37_09740 [Melioribacteraceae bacterium]|nr:hypothetical protein [Melioribacteraceae bacterium]
MGSKFQSDLFECNKCLELGIDYTQTRIENYNFAYSYIPKEIELLWIVESPPHSYPPRYFYRPELTRFDSLFREIMKVLDIHLFQDKVSSLKSFQEKGHFLIDSIKCPSDKSNSHLKPNMMINCSELLAQEILNLTPNKIIIIKADVYAPVKETIRLMDDRSGTDYTDKIINNTSIPFPGSGQQKRFREMVSDLIYSND